MTGRAWPSVGRGSGTMLNVAVMVLLLAVSAVVVVFSHYAAVAHQARNAADLAALAGAQAFGDGPGDSDSGCRAAGAVARANAARVVRCSVVGDPTDFVITVQASVAVEHVAWGLPRELIRTGHAGPVR